jgi:Formate dehydrogenase N, transmembrane
MFAVVVAGVFHYMKVGPLEEPKDEPPKRGEE